MTPSQPIIIYYAYTLEDTYINYLTEFRSFRKFMLYVFSPGPAVSGIAPGASSSITPLRLLT
jgi:hypothetical protein